MVSPNVFYWAQISSLPFVNEDGVFRMDKSVPLNRINLNFSQREINPHEKWLHVEKVTIFSGPLIVIWNSKSWGPKQLEWIPGIVVNCHGFSVFHLKSLYEKSGSRFLKVPPCIWEGPVGPYSCVRLNKARTVPQMLHRYFTQTWNKRQTESEKKVPREPYTCKNNVNRTDHLEGASSHCLFFPQLLQGVYVFFFPNSESIGLFTMFSCGSRREFRVVLILLAKREFQQRGGASIM